MKRVVIESPLSGDFSRNKRYALWCAFHCYVCDESAYASHLIFPQFLDDKNPAHREFGITAGYEWAKKANVFAFYTDLGMSEGMERARDRWMDMADAGATIEERKLTPAMLAAFEDGRYPASTAGF